MGGDSNGLSAKQGDAGQSHLDIGSRHSLAIAGRVFGGLLLSLSAAAVILSRWLAGHFLTLRPDRRRPLLERPELYGLACQDVQVKTADGLTLRGWYLPGQNGATVMVQHGSPGGRQDSLYEAAFLNKRGYNVLLGSFRAHDDCDGVDLSFGYHEMKDVSSWHGFLLNRPEVDPARIGIFGESMGGALGIRYAAQNQRIAAVAVASAPAFMAEVAEFMITTYAPAPRWSVPALTRLFIFWAERKAGCTAADVDVLPHVGRISPRPLLIIHGGAENQVPAEHGRLLYEAAGQPKEFWFVPEAGHVNFELFRPEEYQRRVLAFFNRYLLEE